MIRSRLRLSTSSKSKQYATPANKNMRPQLIRICDLGQKEYATPANKNMRPRLIRISDPANKNMRPEQQKCAHRKMHLNRNT